MRKLLLISCVLLFVLFTFFLLLTVYQLAGSKSSMEHISYEVPPYNMKEDFDPALTRLNTIDKLTDYCDSLFLARTADGKLQTADHLYPEIVNSVISKRFYHGYSLYGFRNNYMAMFLSQASIRGLNAIVVPDDIMEYPYAACSQQSIVMMEVMKRKGFSTRKVGFKSERYGHFCLEVYYAGSWHFFDPDMEPDMSLAGLDTRPGIAYLAANKDILPKLYSKHSLQLVMELFPNYYYGKEDIFPAPKALVFQKVASFLSYTLWIFFLGAFILVYRKYKKLSTVRKMKAAHITDAEGKKSPLVLSTA